MTYCFVIDSKGRKLSPTKENKGWYLIRKKRAKLLNKFPMVIQIYKEIEEQNIDRTPMKLGIDDGSKFSGMALVQEGQKKNKPIFKGTVEHRLDVKDKMDVRHGYRRYKRYHKRYRPKRFNNRTASKRKERIPPSIKQKKEATLRVVNQLQKWTRINEIYLENVQIDIRALEKGYKPYRWQYQRSNRLDENIRKATLMRDHHACQDCGKKNCRLEVHHIIPRRLNGSDTIYNLITLCSECHRNVTNGELEHSTRFFEKINGKQIHFRDAMHVMQGKTYLQKELQKFATLTLTNGGETANRRIDWNIDKTHANDAIVITNLKVSKKQCELKDWIIRPMRKRSKKKTSAVNGFRHRDYVRYTKKSGEIYEGYITALYPEKKQCNITTLDGKILKRYGLKSLKLLWRFQKIYWF